MGIDSIKALFKRDIIKLKNEIELYKIEDNLWKIDSEIKNSGGNLCLHLIGNLRTYIGDNVGKFSYERNREKEFLDKNILQKELIKMIDETYQIVENSLSMIDSEKLNEDFPVIIWEEVKSIDYTLMHLLTHLNYHIGQINYHRRVFDIKN